MNPTKTVTKIFVSVDSVVFGYKDRQVYIPLFRRKNKKDEPFPNHWSLPGGPLLGNERFEESCRRKLEEDIGLRVEFLEQLYSFDDPKRDPRDRSISVSYFAFIRWPESNLQCGSDASEARWFQWNNLPKSGYAFDHKKIIEAAIKRLRNKLLYQPIGLSLLPNEFSLPDLKAIYDTVLGYEIDRRNFSKKILSFGLLIPTEKEQIGRGRPRQLYRFDRNRYQELQSGGFEIGR